MKLNGYAGPRRNTEEKILDRSLAWTMRSVKMMAGE